MKILPVESNAIDKNPEMSHLLVLLFQLFNIFKIFYQPINWAFAFFI